MRYKNKNSANLNWPPEKTCRYPVEFEIGESFISIDLEDIKPNKDKDRSV